MTNGSDLVPVNRTDALIASGDNADNSSSSDLSAQKLVTVCDDVDDDEDNGTETAHPENISLERTAAAKFAL